MLINGLFAKAVASVSFLCVALVASLAAGESFEVRLVHPNNEAIVLSKAQGTDLSNYEKWIWKQRSRNEELWVSKKVEIDIRDFKEAKTRFLKPPFLSMVDVVLTEKGSKKLLDFTSQNVKRRVALFLDGKLLVVPIIFDPLASGILSISGDFDRPEIQIITDRINALIREAASL